MNIRRVRLHIIEMPLKAPFSTHLETVSKRKSIIVEAIDQSGASGFGEVVAFATPWYTEETVRTALHMLEDILIPLLLRSDISHPEEISSLFHRVRRNEMAKAGLETAAWDLYAKLAGKPLWKLIGGVRNQVLAGVVAGSQSAESALRQIEQFVQQGYERVKIKISPAGDYELLKTIRNRFPDLPLMADANSAYTLRDIERLKALDEFGLLMIEQPLGVDDMVEHAVLQREIRTPICLDESIATVHDAESAIRLKSCGAVNIKIGRVGGLWNACRIHDLCLKHGVSVWCGGMIEFGISKAHNIALASKSGFDIPGDIPGSARYWDEDIIEPEIKVEKGRIAVPSEAGIGYSINWRRLAEVTEECRTIAL